MLAEGRFKDAEDASKEIKKIARSQNPGFSVTVPALTVIRLRRRVAFVVSSSFHSRNKRRWWSSVRVLSSNSSSGSCTILRSNERINRNQRMSCDQGDCWFNEVTGTSTVISNFIVNKIYQTDGRQIRKERVIGQRKSTSTKRQEQVLLSHFIMNKRSSTLRWIWTDRWLLNPDREDIMAPQIHKSRQAF